MKRQSIVRKLFIATLAVFLGFFSLVMIAQGLFFERFYRSAKIGALEHHMSRFAEQFGGARGSGQVSRLLGTFMNDNNASTAILNRKFERIAVNPYFLELETAGKTVVIRFPMEGMPLTDIPRGLAIGDTLSVDGIFVDEEDTVMQPIAFRPGSPAPEEGLTRITGRLSDIMLPEQRSYNPMYQDAQLDDALLQWKQNEGQVDGAEHGDKVVQMEWVDEWSGIPYTLLIRPLTDAGNEGRYLAVMTSLQPVGEAVKILKQYVVYIAPVILLLVVLLSLMYSRSVTRPFILLNRSAARLAKLDFTEPPEIRSNDEFGELSRSLVELSRNLDHALTELTEANGKLQADMEEKQRLEQLRKELIANISHELKTPLGIVKGYAEGLQDGIADDKKEQYLSYIVSETDRMNALIMDMLELSKYEVKAVQLQERAVSIRTLVRKVADSFAGQLDNKHLKLHMIADAEDYLVEADPKRMGQVVVNLLSNAIRHARERSVLTIRIEKTTAGRAATTIENVGSPIAEEELGRIWHQFYRIERARDRKSGGTGLGLAIVKHILELHESRFGVKNTNEGVAFYFDLKLAHDNGGIHDE